MDGKNGITTLKNVAADLEMTYKTVYNAARAGRLPAFQLFGKNSTWCVPGNYRDFLVKSRPADGEVTENDGVVV